MDVLNLHIIELAFISALISLFLDFCFREGNILCWWLDFLADTWLGILNTEHYNAMTKEQIIIESGGEYENNRDYKFSKVEWFFFKPLGYCVVCMNFWVSLGIGLFYGHNYEFIFIALVSSLIVRLLHERLL